MSGLDGRQEEAEWKTRRDRIDTRLKALGWKLERFRPGLDIPRLSHHAVTEFETENGPADYVFVVDGRPLGVLEAKRLSKGPQNVLTQAARYARGLPKGGFDFDGHRAPFLWSTNGEVIWFHDVRHAMNLSRQVRDFPTPESLREALGRNFEESCRLLLSTPNAHERLRPYQREANEAVEKAVSNRTREMLVAMATGTGKTFTMVNQAYRLMKSGVARRVLFLVDRRALAAQAVNAFSSFQPEKNRHFPDIYELFSQAFRQDDLDEDRKFDPKALPSAYLLAPKAAHSFVYVCTIQRMAMNLFGREKVLHATSDPL
ncbi:MAG: DEAD/DEAH box helicase family protein, partial [Planctomycetota bacterium]